MLDPTLFMWDEICKSLCQRSRALPNVHINIFHATLYALWRRALTMRRSAPVEFPAQISPHCELCRSIFCQIHTPGVLFCVHSWAKNSLLFCPPSTLIGFRDWELLITEGKIIILTGYYTFSTIFSEHCNFVQMSLELCKCRFSCANVGQIWPVCANVVVHLSVVHLS